MSEYSDAKRFTEGLVAHHPDDILSFVLGFMIGNRTTKLPDHRIIHSMLRDMGREEYIKWFPMELK